MRIRLIGLLVVALLCCPTILSAAEADPACTTALLVIDVQNRWANNEVWHTTADGTYIIDKIVALLEVARAAGLPVIYIQDISLRGSATEEELAFPDAIAPQAGDLVVTKKNPDAFAFTDLVEQLEEAGITRVLISGLASHGCVDATVYGAKRRNYDVIVIEDGHTGFWKGENAIEYNARWTARGIAVIPSSEIDWSTLCAATAGTEE